MGHPNNPFISRRTRRWVSSTSERLPLLLGSRTLPYIFRVLAPCLDNHPGGLIHHLARTIADEGPAIEAAVCGELFFAACNLTDDLQDADTDQYLEGVPFSLRLNTQSLLYSLSGVAVAEFQEKMGVRGDPVNLFSTVCSMLTGQHAEILRDPWDVDDYDRVALAIAGDQFAVYFSLVAVAASIDTRPFAAFGRNFGALIQILADKKTQDERLTVFGEEGIDGLLSRARERCSRSISTLPKEFAPIIETVIR